MKPFRKTALGQLAMLLGSAPLTEALQHFAANRDRRGGMWALIWRGRLWGGWR